MKILLCAPLYAEGASGITKWYHHMMDYFNQELTNKEIEIDSYSDTNKGVTEHLNLVLRLIKGYQTYVPFLRGLSKVLSKKQYDVVQICTSGSLSLIKDYFTIRIAHKHSTKVLVHFHYGRTPEILQKKGWERSLLLKVVEKADGIITIDKSSLKALQQKGFNNIYYLPNPLAPSVEEIINNHSNVERIRKQLLFVGHHVCTKGVEELIQACTSIQGIKLIMIGTVNDEYKQHLYDLAGDNHDEWLDIKGEVPYTVVLQEMAKCEVFVLPTYTEGFPNVIIESMAFGCPIVTTPVGAIPDMLNIYSNEPCGLCVPPKDVGALRTAILNMLDDEYFAKGCANRAYNRVRDLFTVDKVWQQLFSIWNNI